MPLYNFLEIDKGIKSWGVKFPPHERIRMYKNMRITDDIPEMPLLAIDGHRNGIPFTAEISIRGAVTVKCNGKTTTLTLQDILALVLPNMIGESQ